MLPAGRWSGGALERGAVVPPSTDRKLDKTQEVRLSDATVLGSDGITGRIKVSAFLSFIHEFCCTGHMRHI